MADPSSRKMEKKIKTKEMLSEQKVGIFCLEWVEKPVTAQFLAEQEELGLCTDPGLSFTALTSLVSEVLKNCSKLELGVSGEGLFEQALKKNVFS